MSHIERIPKTDGELSDSLLHAREVVNAVRAEILEIDKEIKLTEQDYKFIAFCRSVDYGTLLEIDIRQGSPILVKKGYKNIRFDLKDDIDKYPRKKL